MHAPEPRVIAFQLELAGYHRQSRKVVIVVVGRGGANRLSLCQVDVVKVR